MIESVFSAALVAGIVALIVLIFKQLGIPLPDGAKPILWLVVAVIGYVLGGLIEIQPEFAPVVQTVIEIVIVILIALGLYKVGGETKARLGK